MRFALAGLLTDRRLEVRFGCGEWRPVDWVVARGWLIREGGLSESQLANAERILQEEREFALYRCGCEWPVGVLRRRLSWVNGFL